MFKSKARMYAKANKEKDGSFIFRVAEIKFIAQGRNFVFEEASPFVEAFDRLVRRTIESGIPQKWENEDRVAKKSREEYLMSMGDEFLITRLSTILAFGFGISLIAFVTELTCDFLKRKVQ